MQCFQTKKIKTVRSVLQALAYGLPLEKSKWLQLIYIIDALFQQPWKWHWLLGNHFQCEMHHEFFLYCFKSTKHVLTNLLQVTVILRTQWGCQRGLLQTKKKTEVPIKSRAITWHSYRDISLGLLVRQWTRN